MCVTRSLIWIVNLKGQTHFSWGNFRILSLRFISIMLITAKYVGISVILMDFLCFLFLIQLFIRLLPDWQYCMLTHRFFSAIIYKIVFLFLPLFFFSLWIRLPVCWINVWAGRAINPNFWIKIQTAKAWASLCQQGTAVHTHTHTHKVQTVQHPLFKKGQCA